MKIPNLRNIEFPVIQTGVKNVYNGLKSIAKKIGLVASGRGVSESQTTQVTPVPKTGVFHVDQGRKEAIAQMQEKAPLEARLCSKMFDINDGLTSLPEGKNNVTEEQKVALAKKFEPYFEEKRRPGRTENQELKNKFQGDIDRALGAPGVLKTATSETEGVIHERTETIGKNYMRLASEFSKKTGETPETVLKRMHQNDPTRLNELFSQPN